MGEAGATGTDGELERPPASGELGEAVEQMKAAVAQAMSLCQEGVLAASHSAQQKAASWAGGL